MAVYIFEFELKTKSPITVEDGDVIVDKGLDTVTVRNVEADSPDEAENKARHKANDFLNELSWQYERNLEISNHWTYMLQGSPIPRHIMEFRGETFTTGGRRKRRPTVLKEVKVKPSASKAYFRKAAISNDSFDIFRNYYLAIENVASKIAVKTSRHRPKDGELLKIALRECFSSDLELLEDNCHIPGIKPTDDIIKDISVKLYEEYRCALNHAKDEWNKKIPFDDDDEEKVSSVLPLTKFIVNSLINYEDNNLR